MKSGKRNQGISFLMVVGIIFIVIAGTIFISKAWGYMSIYGKQCILFLVALGLFAGAVKAAKSGVMEKTETALYYLATSFLGLFTMSVFGGIFKTESRAVFYSPVAAWNENAILIAGVVMFLSAGIRFVRIRRAFDFTLMALLADWVVFWFMLSQRFEILGACVLSAITLTVYAAADFMRYIWIGERKNVEHVFYILYILHIVNFVICNMNLLYIDDIFTSKTSLFVTAVFMVCITTFYQFMRNNTIFSVLNSISIYWFIINGVRFVNEVLSSGNTHPWDVEMENFIIFSICAVCMVFFARTEMIWITLLWGMLMPFIQIIRYGDYNLIFFYVKHVPSVYIPFTGVLAAALAIVIYRKYYEGRLDEVLAKQYGIAVCIQLIVMFVMYYASKQPFFDKGIYTLLMLQNLTVSFMFKNKAGKIVFRTFALLFGEMLAFVFVNDLVPVDYRVEFGCLMAMFGVFLLGVIWQNHGYTMRNFQFVSICLILIFMLINAIIYGDVGNALILGITGAVMLFSAAILNSHRYVVVSSVILILLAFYITRSFWFAIEWWVYLFVAGVALIALAIKKEKTS